MGKGVRGGGDKDENSDKENNNTVNTFIAKATLERKHVTNKDKQRQRRTDRQAWGLGVLVLVGSTGRNGSVEYWEEWKWE